MGAHDGRRQGGALGKFKYSTNVGTIEVGTVPKVGRHFNGGTNVGRARTYRRRPPPPRPSAAHTVSMDTRIECTNGWYAHKSPWAGVWERRMGTWRERASACMWPAGSIFAFF